MGSSALRSVRGSSDADDSALVARACSGDRSAEAAIYRRHVAYIAGMVLRLLAYETEAEDVVQDTFVLAFEHLPKLRVGTALRPWLAQIAVSQVSRRLRRRRVLRFFRLDGDEGRPALEALASPEAGPQERAELAALGRVLDSLTEPARIAWSLRYIEGCTIEEAAAACQCSVATIKRRVAAAAARIRGVIDVGEHVVELSSSPAEPGGTS